MCTLTIELVPAAAGFKCRRMVCDRRLFLTLRPGDDEHVEASLLGEQMMLLQVKQRQTGQALFFPVIHRCGGMIGALTLGGTDFDEDDHGAVQGDDVNFAEGASVICGENAVGTKKSKHFARSFQILNCPNLIKSILLSFGTKSSAMPF